MLETSFIRDQSIGVVGTVFMHTHLGVSWLVLALHSLCISWRVRSVLFPPGGGFVIPHRTCHGEAWG